jgi:hypothetical protein
MEDHLPVWRALDKLASLIAEAHDNGRFTALGPDAATSTNDDDVQPAKKLIISTGDISDIDGFYALCKYASTGADVIFIMNYPAYIDEKMTLPDFEEKYPGLGFKYTTEDLSQFEKDKPEPSESFAKFMSKYTTGDANKKMKHALTDIASYMANQVWREAKAKGKLFFCIGGVNAINPFAVGSIKNEILVYASAIPESCHRFTSINERSMYCVKGGQLDWPSYTDIYLDFNGSMAFWDSDWDKDLLKWKDKIRGAFVMGGIFSDAPSMTMPAIPKSLNRFSCATMNQLYHPSKTALFFNFLSRTKIPVFIIANNTVADLVTYSDAEKKNKSDEGITNFLESNGLDNPFLRKTALLFYHSTYAPPRKPFDYYTALALTEFMDHTYSLYGATKMNLFFDSKYGITFVSQNDTWRRTLDSYESRLDTTPDEADTPFIKNKKISLLKELAIMRKLDELPHIPVSSVKFEMDPSKNLRVL